MPLQYTRARNWTAEEDFTKTYSDAYWRDNPDFLRQMTGRDYKNTSGTTLIEGDVCVQDIASSTSDATTTTTVGDTRPVLIAQPSATVAGTPVTSIAIGATDYFAEVGYVLVNTTGAVARNDRLQTSGTAKLAQTGSAGSFARAVTAAAGPGAGQVLAKLDTNPGIAGFATPALVLGTAAAAGSAGTVIRSNSTIAAFKATNPSSSAVGDAAVQGTEVFASRHDHQHGRESFATPTIALGSAAVAGAATTPIRSDSTIAAFDATNPSSQAVGDSAAVGTAAFAARRDHKHAIAALTLANLPTITQRVIATGSAGSVTTTSATFVDLTDMAVTLTTLGGDLLCLLCGTFYHSVAGSTINGGVKLDAAAAIDVLIQTFRTASDLTAITAVHLYTGVSAASHTIKGQWLTSAATATAYSNYRRLIVLELAK